MIFFGVIMGAEKSFSDYLKKISFGKRLKKLTKKLKDKKIIIYGTGEFFSEITKNYDLKSLNIVALCDKSFLGHQQDETKFGYTVCSIDEISDYNPDYILVGTLNFVSIIDDLEAKFADKYKILPLIKKPIVDLWKEIWELCL